MSRFRRLSQTMWHCHFHIPWAPKYRYRVIAGEIADEVTNRIRAFSEHLNCEIIELSARRDHIHLLAMVPPKMALSDYVGMIKSRRAIRLLNKFRHLKEKPYGG